MTHPTTQLRLTLDAEPETDSEELEKLGVSHLIYIGGDGFKAERWTVQPRYFTAW